MLGPFSAPPRASAARFAKRKGLGWGWGGAPARNGARRRARTLHRTPPLSNRTFELEVMEALQRGRGTPQKNLENEGESHAV